jgi:hypothetical protein
MKTGFAQSAYDCYKKYGRDACVEKFNSQAGSPRKVAEVIVRKMNSGKEVITPTFKAWMWYTTRYVGFIVDFVMKRVLGPKELEGLGHRAG